MVLMPLLIVLAAGNLFYGAVRIPPREVVDILFGVGGDNPAWKIILTGSRMPQAVTALLGRSCPGGQRAVAADAVQQSSGRTFYTRYK